MIQFEPAKPDSQPIFALSFENLGRFIGFFLASWLVVWQTSFCQQAVMNLDNWNPGYVVTQEEDTIFGPVTVNYQADLVQVNEENSVKTYGANQIQMIYLKQNEDQEERFFYSYPFHPYSDFKPYKLFEKFYEGPHISLLGREMLVTESIPVYDQYAMRTFYTSRSKIVTDYFIWLPEKKRVKALKATKKEFLQAFPDMVDRLKSFIDKEKLKYTEKEDLIKIVTFYNSLKNK